MELTLEFYPGILSASFFVCDVPHPIIGADLLQNESKDLSLETGKSPLCIGSDLVITKPSAGESMKEFKQ